MSRKYCRSLEASFSVRGRKILVRKLDMQTTILWLTRICDFSASEQTRHKGLPGDHRCVQLQAQKNTLEQSPKISDDVISYKTSSIFLISIDNLCSTLKSQLCDRVAVCGRGLYSWRKMYTHSEGEAVVKQTVELEFDSTLELGLDLYLYAGWSLNRESKNPHLLLWGLWFIEAFSFSWGFYSPSVLWTYFV